VLPPSQKAGITRDHSTLGFFTFFYIITACSLAVKAQMRKQNKRKKTSAQTTYRTQVKQSREKHQNENFYKGSPPSPVASLTSLPAVTAVGFSSSSRPFPIQIHIKC
jgi:hypothetical protein